MRNVLMLAYHYPPIGGAAVMRNARLARMLPAAGYNTTVITGPGGDAGYRWTPTDDSLVEPAAGTIVERLAGPEPSRSGTSRDRAARWLRVPAPWERWWREGVHACAQAVGRDADLIHASVAPYETARAALEVAAALRKPLVLDFEDPWALDEMRVYPTRAHRALERRVMACTLAAADAVVMNTQEAATRVLDTWPELRRLEIASVPNGFDARDFEGPVPERDDTEFRIVHTGSFHTDMGLAQRRRRRLRRLLGGDVPGVDFLPRSPVYLLQALAELAGEQPDATRSIELHLAGVLTDHDRAAALSSPFTRLHGFLDHVETVRLIRSADLLFLPMHDVEGDRRIGIVPCKTYEYAASGRPILAAVPGGDARDLLERLGTASLCAPADVRAMKEAIQRRLAEWRGNCPDRAPDPTVVAHYEYGHLAARLAALYDEVLSAQPRLATGRSEAALA